MSACKVRSALISGLILAFAAAAAAQNDNNPGDAPRKPYYGAGGSTLIFLLTKPGVQDELGLDKSESQKLLESLRKIDPTHSSFRTPEVRKKVSALVDETERKSEAAVQKSLSEEQFRRFQQLEAQYLGGRALLIPKIAEQFALTAEQREKLDTISKEFGLTGRAGAPRLSDEEALIRRKKYNSDLLAVLTPEQTNQWKARLGAPFQAPKSVIGPAWRLVLVPEVQKELGLSEDDAATLAQSLSAIQKEGSSRVLSNVAGRFQADGMRQSQQLIDVVRSSLTVSQWNRLQELILQEVGVESLAHHEVAKELGLGREQRDRVHETMDKYLRGVTGDQTLAMKSKELRARRDKEHADLLDILTPAQKNRWETMQGAKVDRDLFLRPQISPAGE